MNLCKACHSCACSSTSPNSITALSWHYLPMIPERHLQTRLHQGMARSVWRSKAILGKQSHTLHGGHCTPAHMQSSLKQTSLIWHSVPFLHTSYKGQWQASLKGSLVLCVAIGQTQAKPKEHLILQRMRSQWVRAYSSQLLLFIHGCCHAGAKSNLLTGSRNRLTTMQR